MIWFYKKVFHGGLGGDSESPYVRDGLRITPEQLAAALAGEVEQLGAAMNSATPGHLVADSEEPVRDAHAGSRQA